MALQSVSIAPGKSTVVKLFCCAAAWGVLSVRKTRTVKQVRSNKLALYFRMVASWSMGASCYVAWVPVSTGRLPARVALLTYSKSRP